MNVVICLLLYVHTKPSVGPHLLSKVQITLRVIVALDFCFVLLKTLIPEGCSYVTLIKIPRPGPKLHSQDSDDNANILLAPKMSLPEDTRRITLIQCREVVKPFYILPSISKRSCYFYNHQRFLLHHLGK